VLQWSEDADPDRAVQARGERRCAAFLPPRPHDAHVVQHIEETGYESTITVGPTRVVDMTIA
jgi:hypothetical protein